MSPAEDDLLDLLRRINALSTNFGDSFDLSRLHAVATTLETLVEMLPLYRKFVSLLEAMYKVEHG